MPSCLFSHFIYMSSVQLLHAQGYFNSQISQRTLLLAPLTSLSLSLSLSLFRSLSHSFCFSPSLSFSPLLLACLSVKELIWSVLFFDVQLLNLFLSLTAFFAFFFSLSFSLISNLLGVCVASTFTLRNPFCDFSLICFSCLCFSHSLPLSSLFNPTVTCASFVLSSLFLSLCAAFNRLCDSHCLRRLISSTPVWSRNSHSPWPPSLSPWTLTGSIIQLNHSTICSSFVIWMVNIYLLLNSSSRSSFVRQSNSSWL